MLSFFLCCQSQEKLATPGKDKTDEHEMDIFFFLKKGKKKAISVTTRRKKAQIRNLCIRYKILSASINTRLGLPPILFPRRQAWLTRKAQQSGYLMRCLSYQRGLQAGKYRERARAGGTERSERERFQNVLCKHSLMHMHCT